MDNFRFGTIGGYRSLPNVKTLQLSCRLRSFLFCFHFSSFARIYHGL